MNIAIIGTGAYGIALALMFHKNKCNIKMWTKFEEEKEMLETKREHVKALPGVHVPSSIYISNDMKEVLEGAELVVIAVPAGCVDGISKEMKEYITSEQHICIASKGIEQETCSFVYDILIRYIDSDKIAIISGPSFAIDLVNLCPIGLTLATSNKKTDKIIKKALQNNFLKITSTEDILGVQLCGSIKNVISIASGILSGMGFSESTLAMFITEALDDIGDLIESLGGDKNTTLSFAGVGDLFLTATSEKSRNFNFGYLIGTNASDEEINDYINNTTIEGLYTLKSIRKLLKDRKVKLPIINLIYDIIYKNRDANDLVKFLIDKE